MDIRVDIPGWSAWIHPIHDGESVEKVGERTDRVIARIDTSSGPAAISAHGHLLRIFAARWMRLPAGAGQTLGLGMATVSTLGWEREAQVIRHWNEACHLRSMDPAP